MINKQRKYLGNSKIKQKHVILAKKSARKHQKSGVMCPHTTLTSLIYRHVGTRDGTRLKHIILLIFFIISSLNVVEAKEPKKIKVKSVEFENNKAFSDQSLKKVMLNRPSTLFLPVIFNPQLLKEDMDQLELFYHQNGFLEAVVDNYEVSIDSTKHKAHIKISMSEGELTKVEGVSIFGNAVFTDSLFLSMINIAVDDPLEEKRLDKSLNSIINYYADNGYIEAKVTTDVLVNSESHRAVIDFLIVENDQYSIGEIVIKGMNITKKKVVMRELLFERDQIINSSTLLESQRNLYMTGLFKSVFIRPQPSDTDKRKDILIELRETTNREFAVSLGYGSIEKVRTRMEVSNINIYGTARKIGFAGRLSFVNRGVEATFTEPRTFGTLWRTDVTAKTEFQDEPGYDIYTTGGTVSTGRLLYEKIRTIVTLRFENNNLKNIQTTPIPSDIQSQIRSISNSMIRDSRDNLFNSTKGSYIELTNELAGLIYNGNNSFARTIVRVKKFVPCKSYFTLGTSVELGLMTTKKGGLNDIPLNERFYTGGPNSLRGFKYQMIGPLDQNRIPVGGRLKLVINAFEIRKPIYKMVSGVVFSDLGNVWERPEDFSLNSIRFSPGVGLRVDTPIGMGRLDYGFNPYRKAHESSGMFWISIGQAF
jgi:outer membrane protein insertion porin family